MNAVPPPASSGATAVGPRSSATGRVAWVSSAWRSVLSSARRVPRAGRVCFALALVNAAIWGIVVPPFQVPDEIAHFGYAQYLAETGEPPPQDPAPRPRSPLCPPCAAPPPSSPCSA